MVDIVDRLNAHMGKADIADVLPDCREAATTIERYREALEDARTNLIMALASAMEISTEVAARWPSVLQIEAALSHAPEGQPGDGT